ncbi:hypothetical protein HNR77_003269 [Paenibacillus sp. JGP012]|nr:hypothetical protein [Paenibacillus sp. JGP012]
MSALCKLIAGSKSMMVASGRFFKLTGCSYVRLVNGALLPNETGMVLGMNHKMSGQILGEILEVSGFAVVVPEKTLEAIRIVERQEDIRLSANVIFRTKVTVWLTQYAVSQRL